VLQCVAVCCIVLQCVAVCCSVLQCVTVCCSVLQCVTVCCSVLTLHVSLPPSLPIASVCVFREGSELKRETRNGEGGRESRIKMRWGGREGERHDGRKGGRV